MHFIGTPSRISAAGYAAAADKLGCDEATVRAVVEVEAAGRGFDNDGRPKALFEPHKFYLHLGAGPKRDRAVREGLAYRKWKPGNYPKSSDGVYAQIAKACEIDEAAALMATSWGLGQILGEYYDECGFASPQAFVEAMKSGEDRQLEEMVDLTIHWNLDDELRRRDWAGFARGWNGPRYRENRYDEKLADAYALWSDSGSAATKPAKRTSFSVMAQLGSTGPIVEQVQRQLNLVGFRVDADGDFGNETKRAVRLFQLEHGLTADGRVGPKTWAALSTARPVNPEPERAEATAEDLRESGSTIVRSGQDATKIAGAAGTAIAAAKGLDVSGALDQAKALGEQAEQAGAVVQQVQEAAGAAGTFVGFVSDNVWIVAVAALVAVAFLAHRAVKARVADHRAGRTV